MSPTPPQDPTPSTRRLSVDADQAGQRLDKVITAADPDLSRSRVQRLIDDGHVTVDDRKRPASFKLNEGSTVVWQVPPPESVDLAPDPTVEFTIVYEDDDLAVIDKPAGLVVHPAPGHRQGTLVHGLLARLHSLSSVGGRARPGLVHRLDRLTTGLMVVAKNDRAHQHLSDQLKARDLHREYEALCWGSPREAEGTIDLPLDRHPQDRLRRAVREGGRSARTRYRLAEPLWGASRLVIELDTGRTHQIRVHLSHIGHPVLGDPLYGGDDRRLRGAAPEHRPHLAAALRTIQRQALHARRLKLVHPADGSLREFESPRPADLAAALERLRQA